MIAISITSSACPVSLSAGDGGQPDGASQATDGSSGNCGSLGQSCCPGGTCNGTSLACQNGTCVQTRIGDIGKPCSRNADCSSGICLPIGNGQNVCTTTCAGAGSCVPGWTCAPLLGQPNDICQCTYSPEVCDGKDNDCNGIVDDEPLVDQGCKATKGADSVCSNGICVCAAGAVQCPSGQCVNTATDSQNCGTCGHVCPSPSTCSGSVCTCPNGGTLCSQTCVDTLNDVNNCGGCGRTCPPGASCSGGSCACPGGQTACGNACVDLQTDKNNCGTCGQQCTPAPISSCSGGNCYTCGRAGSANQCNSEPYCCGDCSGVYFVCECAAVGQPCNDSSDCCFGATCSNYTCVSCGTPSSSCTSNSQCCSGSCQSGFCSCLPSGAGCDGTAQYECCNGSCNIGTFYGFCP